MKKIILGMLAGAGILFLAVIGGCVLLVGSGAKKIADHAKVETSYKDMVKVQKGWKWEQGDNQYSYIRGRVKNEGDKPVGYFKVVAHFLNSKGEIVDTDYTNSTETLGPGMSKEFEIMYKAPSDVKTASVFVEEVNLKQMP